MQHPWNVVFLILQIKTLPCFDFVHIWIDVLFQIILMLRWSGVLILPVSVNSKNISIVSCEVFLQIVSCQLNTLSQIFPFDAINW